MVLDGLDHHRMLLYRRRDLHPPGPADTGMGDVAVAPDLVGGVDHHNPLVGVVGQYPGHLPEHRRLAHARAAQQEDAIAGEDQVLDDLDGAVDGATDAERKPDYLVVAIADCRDTVECALYPGAVVSTEAPDALEDVLDVLLGHLSLAQEIATVEKPGFGDSAEVQYDLQEPGGVLFPAERLGDVRRQLLDEQLQVCVGGVLHFD